MSYRCVNAFTFGDQLFSGGALVDDSNPILATHGAHFAKVSETVGGVRLETATAGPSEVRVPRLVDPQLEAAAATEAWLAAETVYEDGLAAWLAAEAQYEEDVTEWLLAEEEQLATQRAAAEAPKTQSPPKPGELDPAAPHVGPVTEAPKRRGGRPPRQTGDAK